ncbi:hypothetical protein K0M31_012912, partial [Melipona bicolor]
MLLPRPLGYATIGHTDDSARSEQRDASIGHHCYKYHHRPFTDTGPSPSMQDIAVADSAFEGCSSCELTIPVLENKQLDEANEQAGTQKDGMAHRIAKVTLERRSKQIRALNPEQKRLCLI